MMGTEPDTGSRNESASGTGEEPATTFSYIRANTMRPTKAEKHNRIYRWAAKTAMKAHLFEPLTTRKARADDSLFEGVSDLTAENSRYGETYTRSLDGNAAPHPGLGGTGPPTLRSIVTRKIQKTHNDKIGTQAQEYR